MPEPCGARFRKPVHAITDRAKRYRAHSPGCRPKGPKQCHWCGTRNGQIVPDHKDGDESNGRPSNLVWACKSCNTERGKRMAKAGKGVRTRQYNPMPSEHRAILIDAGYRDEGRGIYRDSEGNKVKLSTVGTFTRTTKSGQMKVGRTPSDLRNVVRNPSSSGAVNLAQYVQAAMDHVRGSHDAAGEIIHNTPKAKRREFAKEIWFRRGYRGKNPAQRSLAKKIDAILPQPVSAHESDFFADLEERLLGKQSHMYKHHATRKPSFIAKNKRNPSEADILYKKFHGRGPDKITTMLVAGVDPYGGHPELTSLGPLIRLVVGEGAEMDEDGTVKEEGDWVNEICFVPMAEYRKRIERLNTKDKEQVREFKAWLKQSGAPDVAAVPNTRQLYFVGGKQFLDDAMLKSLGSDPEKDLADLGFCFQIEYVAQKRFDKFEVMTYYHAFGEVTHVQPRVIYRKPQKMLELVGGEYEVKSIGIDN